MAKRNFFANMKISRKLVAVFLATSVIALSIRSIQYSRATSVLMNCPTT